MHTSYDIVIIGSGPGGYVCAIRAAQLGKKVALIEKYATLGGTCLNVGCIPSKALLDSSEHFYNATQHFPAHGISIKEAKVDIKALMKRKDDVVSQTCAGIDFLMKKNKIDVYHGTGSFTGTHTVEVKGEKENVVLEAKNIVIATGSKPTSLPGMAHDKKRIITSTEALSLKEIPKHLLVIGGGVIGLELGSVYKRLGAKVSVIEYADSLLPFMDASLGKELQRILKKQGMEFYLSHKVKEVVNTGKTVSIKAEDKKGKAVEFEGDYCLLCVGRSPYTQGLNAEKAGVSTDEKGRISVNENLQTSQAHIYAIGDVVRGPMLAHKAEEEGVFVAEHLAGQHPHIAYHLIPGVVYTWPEVSASGYTEEQLKEKGMAYKAGTFPFRALGRSRASGDTDGFVKVLADVQTDEVLGVHMIGPRAADLIMEAVVAMEYRASAEDIARMCHPHPTFTEAIKEAALDATEKRALHM